jgi:hypothetical protein
MVGINLKAGNYAKASNSFTVDVNLRNADFMQKVFHSPISVDQPAHLQMTFIDSQKHYNGTLSVPELSLKEQSVTDARLTMKSSDGTSNVDLSGSYGDKMGEMTYLNAALQASADIVHGDYSWANNSRTMSGTARTLTQFLKYDRRHGLQSLSVVDTTNITVNGTIWNLSIAQILTDMGKVTVTDLNASNNDQFIYANGTVSSDSSDV